MDPAPNLNKALMAGAVEARRSCELRRRAAALYMAASQLTEAAPAPDGPTTPEGHGPVHDDARHIRAGA